DAAQLCLRERLAAVERDLAVGDLHREITGLHLEVALEPDLRCAARQRQGEVLDTILRGDAALAVRDVGDGAVVDRDFRGERARRARATASAAARRALRRLR